MAAWKDARSCRPDESAASEIVGALMLIMIVVAASASFATFALQKQEEIQDQRQLKHLKDSEDFIFTDIDLVDDNADGAWDEITVTVQPLHLNDFMITGAQLDGNSLRELNIERHHQPAPNKYRIVAHDQVIPYTYSGDYVDPVAQGLSSGDLTRLTIPARETFKITINLRDTSSSPQGGGTNDPYNPLDDSEDFFGPVPVIKDIDAFRIRFSTGYLNQPEQSYVPPAILAAPRLDCAYDLLTFEVKEIRVHQERDYALNIDWSAITTGAGGPFPAGQGYQYIVNVAASANGDTITATVAVQLASGLRSSQTIPVTLPVGCV